MNSAFVGIDVACAKRKRLPVSVCTWRDGRLVPKALRLLPIEPPRGQGNVATLDRTRVLAFVREAVDYVVRVCDELRLTPGATDGLLRGHHRDETKLGSTGRVSAFPLVPGGNTPARSQPQAMAVAPKESRQGARAALTATPGVSISSPS